MIKDKIYNIDCLEGFSDMKDDSITHIVTSPPYNRKHSGPKGSKSDKYKYNTDNIENYYEWLCSVIDECLRVTSGYVFFNIMKNYYNKKDVFKLIGNYSDKIQELIIWEKTNPLPASGKSITNAYEFFIVFGDKPLKSNTTYTKNIITTSVNSKTTKEHKAIMKQEVCDWVINKFTTEGDLILDPFMGAGTTAISCINNNRGYIGFEISEEYVALSEKRIEENVLRNSI